MLLEPISAESLQRVRQSSCSCLKLVLPGSVSLSPRAFVGLHDPYQPEAKATRLSEMDSEPRRTSLEKACGHPILFFTCLKHVARSGSNRLKRMTRLLQPLKLIMSAIMAVTVQKELRVRPACSIHCSCCALQPAVPYERHRHLHLQGSDVEAEAAGLKIYLSQ